MLVVLWAPAIGWAAPPTVPVEVAPVPATPLAAPAPPQPTGGRVEDLPGHDGVRVELRPGQTLADGLGTVAGTACACALPGLTCEVPWDGALAIVLGGVPRRADLGQCTTGPVTVAVAARAAAPPTPWAGPDGRWIVPVVDGASAAARLFPVRRPRRWTVDGPACRLEEGDPDWVWWTGTTTEDAVCAVGPQGPVHAVPVSYRAPWAGRSRASDVQAADVPK